ncbi:hypothetical protein B5807_05494 [Epicoccum nigrum]|uniref:Uncharacterized protein n=1 Tax=Epicoccum nigrum TaxID=105696 RepID=A0A1Y2LZJ9_EPING|nr:hypothetical protein B5807_05494 [Epicoccum nigrum]
MLMHSWTEHRQISAQRSSRNLHLSCSTASETLKSSEPRKLFLKNHRLKSSIYRMYMVQKCLNREHSYLHSSRPHTYNWNSRGWRAPMTSVTKQARLRDALLASSTAGRQRLARFEPTTRRKRAGVCFFVPIR